MHSYLINCTSDLSLSWCNTKVFFTVIVLLIYFLLCKITSCAPSLPFGQWFLSLVRTSRTYGPYIRSVALSCNAFLLYGSYVWLLGTGSRTYGPYRSSNFQINAQLATHCLSKVSSFLIRGVTLSNKNCAHILVTS